MTCGFNYDKMVLFSMIRLLWVCVLAVGAQTFFCRSAERDEELRCPPMTETSFVGWRSPLGGTKDRTIRLKYGSESIEDILYKL
ncbi:hypothetical protein BDN70DRAFT_881935 [Pholiota conissans]|uniref:Secreted protein n=1 Tax=Pholiota conissans TaxID=109636 RepID=A0A9P6CRA6_9AGAR|nr:hypothetical protein BDN70DRAFT_881935 [Pholiota conissans]